MQDYFYACAAAAVIAAAAGWVIIPFLKKFKAGQNILGYVKEHEYKRGTPTMGGIIFVFAAITAFFIFRLRGGARLATVCAAIGASYMAVGFIDDFIKIKLKRNEGLSAIQKTAFELMIALIISGYSASRGLTKVYLPFTGEIIDLRAWYFPICVFVFLAVTNSVNLTDGLDGLAAGTGYIYAACMAIVILLQVENFPTRYANGAEYKNLSLLLCALSGGLIGFLLFNTYKASVFMGDTGSLALGGFIASASLISGNLIFIPVIGITYVASSISVILQVAHFKRTGKRIFLMSPLHHHFQHKGYAESKIVFAYKFITFFVGLICIISCIRR